MSRTLSNKPPLEERIETFTEYIQEAAKLAKTILQYARDNAYPVRIIATDGISQIQYPIGKIIYDEHNDIYRVYFGGKSVYGRIGMPLHPHRITDIQLRDGILYIRVLA